MVPSAAGSARVSSATGVLSPVGGGTRETSAQWAVDEVKVTRVSQPKQTRPFLQKGLV